MNYIVLSRKWRPENFDQVVGQDQVTRVLSNALKSNRVSHSYLFSGPRGVGKTTVARILAKKLNDLEDINSSLDVIELDGASNRGIDEIRDLKDSINYVPVDSKYKVFIIDEAHMLTKEAFNALLKTLEEPPAHVVFILATTESQKIPPTISSRCQKYEFKRITVEKIITHMESILEHEGYQRDIKALNSIAIKADGSLRDALSLLDKIIALSDKTISYDLTASALGIVDQSLYLELTNSIFSQDVKECLKCIDLIVSSGVSNNNFLDGYLSYIRDAIFYIIMEKDNHNMSKESMNFLNQNKSNLVKFKYIMNSIIEELNSRNNLNIIEVENLFLKFFKLNQDGSTTEKKQILKNDSNIKQVNKKVETDIILEKSKPNNKVNDLMSAFNQNLKKIESDNIRFFCVLEKVSVSQVGSNKLEFNCSKLSKFDQSLLEDNIDLLNKDLNDLLNIQISIITKNTISEDVNVSENGNIDKNPDLLNEVSSKIDLPDKKDGLDDGFKEINQERKEHPLVDIAINDFNGKIVK